MRRAEGPHANEDPGFRPAQLERGARRVRGGDLGGAATAEPQGQGTTRRGEGTPADLRVLIVGAGGLGSSAALALAESGVGTLGLVDDDTVDLSNLHRQLLHTTADVGRRKVDSAADTLAALAPSTTVLRFPFRLDPARAAELLPQFDIVLEGSDNFATKFLVNDACVLSGMPFVIGGAVRWNGQLLAWSPDHAGGAGCYRCLFEAPPPAGTVPSCQEAGILGPVCGVVGGLAAAAVLALSSPGAVVGRAPRPGQIYLFDALAGTLRRVPFRPNPECAVCGPKPSIRTLAASNYREEHP